MNTKNCHRNCVDYILYLILRARFGSALNLFSPSFRHCIICTQSLRYLFALLLLFFSYFFLVSLVLFFSHLFISINTLKIAVFYEPRSDHFGIFIVYYFYFVRFQFQCSHLILASHLKWKKTIFDVIQKYST